MASKCKDIEVLRSALRLINGVTEELKPNGCTMFKTTQGLVINTYNTNSYVFQGDEKGDDKNKILSVIEKINEEKKEIK